jgi:hypothetical protein
MRVVTALALPMSLALQWPVQIVLDWLGIWADCPDCQRPHNPNNPCPEGPPR